VNQGGQEEAAPEVSGLGDRNQVAKDVFTGYFAHAKEGKDPVSGKPGKQGKNRQCTTM